MNDNQNPGTPEGMNPDDFEAFLRRFTSGNEPFDAEKLASAAGMPLDPAAMQEMLSQLKRAMSSLQAEGNGVGVNWDLGDGHLLEANTLVTGDDFQFSDQFGYEWANRISSLIACSRHPRNRN